MSTITREFTKEQLQQIIETDHVQCGEASSLARIALESLEAEAVCVIDQSNLDYLKSGSDADVWPASRAEMGDVLLYRSATPAPVSVPAAMEMDDDFDSAFEHGKAVGWNACRAAMLQGADRNSPVIPDWQAEAEKMAEIHGTSFVVFRNGESPQCADPTKVIISFTDEGLGHGAEAHFREIVNSSTNNCRENEETSTKCWCRTCRPVTISDMRFVVCPDCGNKRCPHANDHRNACTGSNEPGQEGSAYPAAPQQEVESQIRKGKTVAREEWELGARLTKHRFKP